MELGVTICREEYLGNSDSFLEPMLLIGKSVSVPRAWTSNSDHPLSLPQSSYCLVTNEGMYISRRGPSILVYATGNQTSSHVPYQCFSHLSSLYSPGWSS